MMGGVIVVLCLALAGVWIVSWVIDQREDGE